MARVTSPYDGFRGGGVCTAFATFPSLADRSSTFCVIGHSHDGQIFDGHAHVHDNRSQS